MDVVKLIKALVVLIPLLIISFFSYPIFLRYYSPDMGSSIVSPLPQFLTKNFASVLGFADHWRPNMELVKSNIPEPELSVTAALSYDLTSDKLIYEVNPKKRVPIASLTKTMTAIIALENMDMNKKLTVSKKAAGIGENSMGLTEGEILKLEDLLYGLVLLSGNDAAETIAEGSPFGRDNFVYLMNKRAEELGLTDTRFTNPSGLEGDGDQYSTAYDLLVISRYALQNPDFSEIVSTVTHDIPASSEHNAYYLFNETNLLTSYPGVKGVKTGYTNEAGLCLVTYLEYKGHKIIAVLLNAQNRRQEMKDLLDYSLKTLGVEPPPHI